MQTDRFPRRGPTHASSAVSLVAIKKLALLVALVAIASCGAPSDDVNEATRSSSAASVVATGVDYSWARPSPSGLRSQGYTFAARYLSHDTSGKNLSASEANALWAAGVDVVANWEDSATNALDGHAQGVSDAQAANAQANAYGIPGGRPIYFSVDFDATVANQTAINAYFDGVASVIGVARTGAYGGYYVIQRLFDAGKIAWGWQTYAWSGGQWDARAQLRQVQNGITAAGDANCCDEDQAVATDYGQWHATQPYAAQFVSQSFPLATTTLTMVEGQVIPSFIELKNVGSRTWDSSTRIGTTQARDRNSVFADGTWLSPSRLAHVTGTVPPGGTYKFQFDLAAPSTPGTHDEFFGVLQEGVAWFSDPGQGGPADNDLEVKIDVVAPEYRGTFKDQSFPLSPAAFTVHEGDAATGYIELTNTGTQPWKAGTTKLAPIPHDVASPFANASWLSPTRVSTVAADVAPGAVGRFDVSLDTSVIGDTKIGFGIVEEGVTWFSGAGQGGPADGFLEVHLVVVAQGAPLDAGAPHGDAGSGTHIDSGSPLNGADSGGGAMLDAGGGDDLTPGDDATSGASGCSVSAARDDRSPWTFVLAGMIVLGFARRRGRIARVTH